MTTPKPPLLLRLVGLVPLGVGVLVLLSAWTPIHGIPIDDAPLFFRLFGSFVALFFVIVGLAFLTAKGPARPGRSARSEGGGADRGAPSGTRSWSCPHCGAPLAEDTRISPSGDVLCPFCESWFQVRSR